MSRARKLLSTVGVLLLVLGTVFFAMVRVQRVAHRERTVSQSRATGLAAVAGEPTAMEYLRAAAYPMAKVVRTKFAQGVVGGVAGGVPGGVMPDQDKADRSIVHTAALTLVVKRVPDAIEQLRRVTVEQRGEVDESRQWSLSEKTREGAVTVRVPSASLGAAIKQFESIALRVTNEQFSASDVTRSYTDYLARMRSLTAEEQQYLQILKQAKSAEDVLNVTEKLTEVRTSIEQLQTEINNLRHEVAMSAVTISVTQDAPEAMAWSSWHPLVNARQATRNLVEGLADWADAMVTLVIYLPVVALWVLTVGGILGMGWKVLRFGWWHRKPGVVAASVVS